MPSDDKTLSKQSLHTSAKEQFIDITPQVEKAVREMGLTNGLVVVYAPHTTAAIAINENHDPTVAHDILVTLDHAAPLDRGFQHLEGNSIAHAKSALVGCSQTVIVQDGQLVMGTWQGIFFCEFDGPRHRTFYVKGLTTA
jgi:secondary thiamine-phosphate synthase enzyme